MSLSHKHTNGNNLRPHDVSFKRILVPVDFSACTLETLRYATALARPFDAVVDVLHVIQPGRNRTELSRPYPAMIRAISEGARQELKRLVGILQTGVGGNKFSVRVREGHACEVILNEACSSKADLIVIGTRNRSWLSRLWRHHTVKRVIQNSPCPVMVLRSGMKGSVVNRLRTTLFHAISSCFTPK